MPIKCGSYNSRNVRNGGLESVLWRIYQSNIDLGSFQETNITNKVYMEFPKKWIL